MFNHDQELWHSTGYWWLRIADEKQQKLPSKDGSWECPSSCGDPGRIVRPFTQIMHWRSKQIALVTLVRSIPQAVEYHHEIMKQWDTQLLNKNDSLSHRTVLWLLAGFVLERFASSTAMTVTTEHPNSTKELVTASHAEIFSSQETSNSHPQGHQALGVKVRLFTSWFVRPQGICLVEMH